MDNSMATEKVNQHSFDLRLAYSPFFFLAVERLKVAIPRSGA